MNARFTTELHVHPLPGKELLWMLDATLCYEAGKIPGCGQNICVPKNFVTDFASIPRVFWRLFLPSGLHREAAVVHDWLYFSGDRARAVCDAIFLEAMESLGVSRWRRQFMFLAVRIGGQSAWRAHRKLGHSAQRFFDLQMKGIER